MLATEGHAAVIAPTSEGAKSIASDRSVRPDVLMSDYHLGGEIDGLKLAVEIAALHGGALQTVILTGDITAAALGAIAATACVRLAKRATAETLVAVVAALLGAARATASDGTAGARPSGQGDPNRAAPQPIAHVIDDDPAVCEASRSHFAAEGLDAVASGSAEAFLAVPRLAAEACLVVDERLPGMTGVVLPTLLWGEFSAMPAIAQTGHGDAATAVAALRAGAADFIEKQAQGPELLASVARARAAWRRDAAVRFESLTPRERDVLAMALSGIQEQEHRRRSRHQPAQRREPPRLCDEEDRRRLPARPRPPAVRRNRAGLRRRRRRRAPARTAPANARDRACASDAMPIGAGDRPAPISGGMAPSGR